MWSQPQKGLDLDGTTIKTINLKLRERWKSHSKIFLSQVSKLFLLMQLIYCTLPGKKSWVCWLIYIV